MRISVVLFGLFLLVGCADQEVKEEASPIIRNLPSQDREFLLEPLEAALDDIREIIDYDPGLMSDTVALENGEIFLRLNGIDTMKLEAEWEEGPMREKHIRYWDENGTLFFMQSHFTTMANDTVALERREYRVYLEEGGEVISTYGKNSYGKRALPKEWYTICPTAEELSHLLQRTSELN